MSDRSFTTTAQHGSAHLALGSMGEDLACAHYVANGWTVVARNWRCSEGEIDLIAMCEQVTVFCEVKTRSSDRYGLPAEAVGRAKQLKLRRLAALWLQEHPGHHRVRFDVASVLGGRVEIIEEAF